MIPNPSNSLLGNNSQPTFEQVQQRLAQQVQDNQNPNTAQQLIDLLQQSNAAMGLVPGAGAEADQTLQQLNPRGPQSMQDMQRMRQEIEEERKTDEYPFYDEKELQANFERQKRAEDRQWQGFISSYKKDMKDKINQEHKDHVTFMTATGGTPLNIGEFAQQTGYLGGNKLQEAWEAHKKEAKDKPPSTLYDDYNQTLLDSMEHYVNFDMEGYNASFDKIKEIQKRISEHHANAEGVDNLSQQDRYEVQNLMRSLNENARHIDALSGTGRNARNKEAEVHIRNIFPNGFNPSIFKNSILTSDPNDYFLHNFKLNAHQVQNVTAEHHLAEAHPRTLNRIKESNLPSELKNSIINSNSLIPLYEQLADDIIEAHEAVDYTDMSHHQNGIGNKIHEGLKEKYGFLTLEHEIKQPTISFEKLLYNKFSKSTHQDVPHLKATLNAFNNHFDDDDVHRGKIFPYGLDNGIDFDIFRHLVSANKERATMNKMFKSPLDYVIDNLIAKASIKKFFSGQGNLGFQNANQRKVYSNIPTLEDLGLSVSDLQGIRNMAVRRLENRGNPSFFQPTPLRGEKVGEPLRFERDIHREGGATIPGFTPDYQIPDDPKKEIQGTFVYPPDVAALAPAHKYLRRPDMSPNPGSPTALLGLLDKPEWRAGVLQGRSQTEGYQPHGFQQDSYVRLDGPFGYAPIGDRQSWNQGALDVIQDAEKATYSDNQPMYDVLSRLSATKLPYQTARHDEPLLDRWGGARVVTGEPMDIAMRLLKNDDGLDELSDDDFYLQYLFGNAPSEMNERQRMVADAALDLPESYLAEEGWDSNSMSDLFHPDPNVHESIPDHEYELAASKIKHFKDEINSFMSNPDLPKDDFMDDLEHPKHPWNLAQAKAEKEMSTRNEVTTGEPMDLAMDVLLKLELAPPMTQGVEEQIPMQEDIPMVETMDYNNCDCAEKIRNAIIQNEIENIRNGRGHQDIVDYFKRVSCEEIQQMYFYEEAAIMYCGGLSEADQMKYTGEPMDLAIDSLLKASMYFGAGENADPKGVRQASLEGHQFASQPAMQQAAQASDARIRDLTGGSQELGTMLSTNQWNPESAWGGQSEETPFRGINLSEYGRRLGLGQFGDDEDTQERKLIDHMGQTATHEATHEAQRLPLNEAFTESIYAGNNPSPQQFTNWDEYGAITSQVGPTPSPNFYPGFTGQQATQALANMHPAIVQTGEPMNLAMDFLLKDRISPEAKQHKLEYDKKYESSPERVKYREELNRERRKRGIYGKHNHMDVSHTEGGKLTLESEHGNRARHFKEKGTLRHEE